MKDREAVNVLIVNDDGQYLAGTATEWEFTDDRTRARVFDYIGERVAEQIELVRKAHGKVWIAGPNGSLRILRPVRMQDEGGPSLFQRGAVSVRRLQGWRARH